MTFPTIPTSAAGRIVSSANTNPAGTHTFPNLNTLTKNSGDLLIALVIQYDGNSTNAEYSAWGASFTEFVDQTTTTTMGIGAAYKWSDGAETGTFTVTSADASANDSVCILLSIPGAHQSTPPEGGTIANGTTAAADPGSLDPAEWNTEDTLWIAVCGAGETSTTGAFTAPSAAPANYNNLFVTALTADVVGGVYGAVAFRQLAASSEDVGTFTVDVSNARNSALLIAVRPAPDQPVGDPYQRDPRWYRGNIFFRPSAEPFHTLGDATTPGEAAATNADAEAATFTIAAENATVAVAPSAESAAVTVAAQDLSAGIAPTSETAEFTFAAQDAVVVIGTFASAEVAAFTLVAPDPQVSVAPSVEAAEFTLAAQDATVQTTAAAADPNQTGLQVAWMFQQPNAAAFQLFGDRTTLVSGATSANAENAGWTVTAGDVQAGVAPSTESAPLTVAGQDATTQVAPTAENVSLTFAAQDATVTTSGSSSPTPSSADLTVVAEDPSTAIAPHAENAAITMAAQDATVVLSKQAFAECAVFTVAGADPSAAVAVLAEAAAIVAEAFDGLVTGGEHNATSTVTVTAGRTSVSTVTDGITSTVAVSAAATSTPSVSDG